MTLNRTLTAAAVLVAGLFTSSVASAGAVAGPQIGHGEVVNGYTTIYYYVDFHGNELAEVAVKGDGIANLDLYIYDQHGNLIASDTGVTDACLCQWYPLWTGTFRIDVHNVDGVHNIYNIGTN